MTVRTIEERLSSAAFCTRAHDILSTRLTIRIERQGASKRCRDVRKGREVKELQSELARIGVESVTRDRFAIMAVLARHAASHSTGIFERRNLPQLAVQGFKKYSDSRARGGRLEMLVI